MATFLRPKVKPHMFMPGETISGAIKKYNLYDVKKEEMVQLLKLFNQINPAQTFRPGSQALIPILNRHHEAVFKQ